MVRTILALVVWMAVCLPATAQSWRITSPARGSTLRAEILDALRPNIERETGGPVQFVITALNVMGPWAYVDAKPQRPDGRPINWRATKFRQAYEADMFSGLVLALLLQRLDGSWIVVGTFIGPTDVAWYEWVDKYKLPEALFRNR
jgi:hypothetical protein